MFLLTAPLLANPCKADGPRSGWGSLRLGLPAGPTQTRPAGTRLVPQDPRQEAMNGLQQWSEQVAQTARAAGIDPKKLQTECLLALLKGSEAPRKPPVTRLYSMGGFEVYKGDERLDERTFKSQKVRYLLAFLAAHKVVPEDVVLEAFWPDDPHKGRKSLNASTSHLRAYLKPEGWPGKLNPILRTTAGLKLNPAFPHWHDLDELQQALDQQDDRRAVELYRGPFLEGCYMDWAVAIRHRLERPIGQALLRLAQAQLKTHPQEAAHYAERLLELDPCSQDGFLVLMWARMAQGKPEEAVRQFRVCAQRLRDELGMEPAIALLEARQRALLSLS